MLSDKEILEMVVDWAENGLGIQPLLATKGNDIGNKIAVNAYNLGRGDTLLSLLQMISELKQTQNKKT